MAWPNPSAEPVAAAVSLLDEKQWLSILSSYREPRLVRALIELATTALPFFALWAAVMIGLQYGYLLSLLLTIPAAGFLVRLFMIQHDCGHGSFFRQRLANDWVGRVIGVLTLTPYDYWRRSHAIHHATPAIWIGGASATCHADGAGISQRFALAPHRLSTVAQSAGPARRRSDLPVLRPASRADRADGRGGGSGSAPWRPTSPSPVSWPA